MIALALMADALTPPDAEPMRAAVAACDRGAMAALTRAEPHRRADFALAAYAEQRALARARADLPPPAAPLAPTPPAMKTIADTARTAAALDARQRRLDDARAVEKAWREAVDELRADFLANCDPHKPS